MKAVTAYLLVEVIVEIVPDRPPGVVVRIVLGQEEEREPPAQPPPGVQRGQVAHTLVEGEDVAQRDGPHGPGLPGGVEVHVLVDPGPGLIPRLEVCVPAAVGAVVPCDVNPMVRPQPGGRESAGVASKIHR